MRCRGEGPVPADWFLCGEGPGQNEDRVGLPFQGKTGEELRRFFDGDALPKFIDIFRSNLYRLWGGKDYEYTPEDFARDEPELLDELAACQPSIIVAIGRHAARYFLGDVSMDEVHGLPWYLPADSKAARALDAGAARQTGSVVSRSKGRARVLRNAGVGNSALSSPRRGKVGKLRVGGGTRRKDCDANVDREAMGGQGVVVFPCYHPAAGFRSPELSALVSYDFAQLAMFAAGELKPRKLHDDPYPTPRYELLEGEDAVSTVLWNLAADYDE